MKPLLIAPAGRSLGAAPLGRRGGDLEVRRVPVLPTAGALDTERATVVVVDRALIKSLGGDEERLTDLAKVVALVAWCDPGEQEPCEEFPLELFTGFITGDASQAATMAVLRGAFLHAATQVKERRARRGEQERYRELTELTRVGVALSTERNLSTLLEMILEQARRLAQCDAGSLYLVDRSEDGKPPTTLRFKHTQNFSLPNLPFQESTVPIDHQSLSGYAAATGEPLVIGDVYLLPEDVEYRQNRYFDEKFGYRTRSMLVLPMKTHRDEVIGVLQLINRKKTADAKLNSLEAVDREVIPFDQRAVEVVAALASQAAVAIENSLLYEDIEALFEGFVTAAVAAIESRDPTTSGHSGRVATLTVGLAEAIDRGGEGSYKNMHFSREQLRELRYAGLLHDFGKIGVREQVLVKQKKLYPWDMEIIRHRFAFLLQRSDLEFERERAEYLLEHGRQRYADTLGQLEMRRRAQRSELQHYLDVISKSNEPTILPEGASAELAHINERTYMDFDGVERALLSDSELRFLMIRKGNLDDRERREIESHVTHTFRFLEQIPWTRELRGVPEIAYGHHEKLDGRGYPRQIRADAIPVQTRMMTIADIFDALTATDRPYKRAVPRDRALDILHDEAKSGLLDPALLETFIQAEVFDLVLKGRDARTPPMGNAEIGKP